jgi:hypothetical protein
MEKAVMKNQVEFKVGDIVLITHYDKERNAFWDENTIGDTAKVVEELSDGCFKLSNEYAYHPSELEFVSEGAVNNSSKKDATLTQPELQFLTKFLSDTLCSLQSDIKYYETCAANIWDKCNKEDADADTNAARWFKTLNHYKDRNKQLKKTAKKLSEVQGKLKRQVGK